MPDTRSDATPSQNKIEKKLKFCTPCALQQTLLVPRLRYKMLGRMGARIGWIWLWIKSCLPNRSPRETELAAERHLQL